MKLREMVYWEKFLYEVIEFIGDTVKKHGNEPVRVEIHSIDDEWTESAPDGWGPGWPFKIGDTVMIAADDGQDQHELEILAFVPSTGRIQRANVLDIDAYGRKG